jgi:Rrf2 family protein
MKVGNKVDYAFHAMMYVAANGEKRPCTISEIAENENIPREYLAKILKELTVNGFLKSTKGIYGGYRLAKAPEDISFLKIMESFDGPLHLCFCTMPEQRRDRSHRKGRCASYQFWEEMQRKVKADLADINLGKLDLKKFYSSNKIEQKNRERRIAGR